MKMKLTNQELRTSNSIRVRTLEVHYTDFYYLIKLNKISMVARRNWSKITERRFRNFDSVGQTRK